MNAAVDIYPVNLSDLLDIPDVEVSKKRSKTQYQSIYADIFGNSVFAKSLRTYQEMSTEYGKKDILACDFYGTVIICFSTSNHPSQSVLFLIFLVLWISLLSMGIYDGIL